MTKVRPFLKWAGGKTKLLPILESLYPTRKIRSYIEPFLGGGSTFFHVLGILKPKSVILNDFNQDLVNAYRVVRDEPIRLITSLKKHRVKHSEAYFYKLRESEPGSKIESASRFIYLNKTCFNGLYRVNQKGKFNVPFGKCQNPEIFDEINVKAISRSLSHIQIAKVDFQKVCEKAKEGDFVYFDPPYHSESASFTSYTSKKFSELDQRNLASWFRKLDRRGCLLMLSNNDTELIRELYRGFNFTKVSARRSINPKLGQKSFVPEIVIRNYT